MREWIMDTAAKAFNFVVPFYWLGLFVVIFILLPLTLWRRTREKAGGAMMLSSYLFGITTWLLGVALTFGSFGWLGLVIGLFVFGVGVVPLGIGGAFFKLDQTGMALILLFMAVTTIATRFGGAYAITKAET